MKVFAQWVLERRYRLILVAIAAAPLLPVVATALMTLETIRRGGLQGAYSAAAGIGGVLLLSMAANSDPGSMAALATMTFGAGVALGILVRWANSLALAFQGSLQPQDAREGRVGDQQQAQRHDGLWEDDRPGTAKK